jgi:TetR/AcrR family transcriptional regulator, transcriptional repressor for nem operon
MPWEKQFDRTEALLRAQQVFWKTGYEKSSLTVLLKRMGIQKGSFYATFKSKHKVLVEALHLYIQHRFESFLAAKTSHPPLVALRQHLDEVLRESIGPDRSLGCLLVNCATELAPKNREVRAIVSTTLRAQTQFYESLLEEAKDQGTLPQTVDTAVTASALLGLVLAMRVCARGGAPPVTIRALRRQAEDLISGGRVS